MANLEVSRGERLDQRVVSLLPALSRSFATQLIKDGKVRINGLIATKAGTKIRPHDDVVLDYDLKEFTIPKIELPIIYEDGDCVVINKPSGLLTHSKGAFNPEPSVATWLHNRITDESLLSDDEREANNRAGIVHRLDRATSGVMICAKTCSSLKFLQKQFASRKVHKTYTAIISGKLNPSEAVIDMPIERNPKAPATFRTGVGGKTAQTHYKTLESGEIYSLLELRPTTGRTHQLRVHLKQMGHPIVGDEIYGGEPVGRLMLHAKELNITLPNGKDKTFTVTIPSELTRLIT